MKQNLKVLSYALALLASACSTLGGQPTQTSGPIKIGMVTSLTGSFAPLGTNNKLAVQQVFDEVNAQGGIGGRTLALSALDDGSDPNQTVVQFNKLLDDGSVAVIGTPQTTANLAIKAPANDRKIPTIALAAADSQVVPVSPYMWMTAPLSSQVAATCLASMQQHGLTRLAMLSDSSNGYAVTGHDAAKQALGQYGVTLLADESFEPSQTNFAPQLARIEAASPDVVLVWAVGAPAVIITKAWANEGTRISLMMTAAEASPLYLQPSGAAAEGVLLQGAMGVIGDKLPAGNPFKKSIDAFAGPFQQANNYYPPQFAWDGMLAATFLADAIRRQGPTSEQIRSGLDSIDLDTPQGHYTFSPTKHSGLPDSASLMLVVKNGQFEPLDESEDALARAGR